MEEEQVVRWPILLVMALDILPISAMSDDIEGAFSGARRTIRWDRMSLGERSIQATECLKSWFRDLKIYKEIGIGTPTRQRERIEEDEDEDWLKFLQID
jgi:hypothetical protein